MIYAFGLLVFFILSVSMIANHVFQLASTVLTLSGFQWSALLSGGFLLLLFVFGFVVYQIFPRLVRRARDRTPIFNQRFLWESGYGLKIGFIVVWLGLILTLGSLGFAIYLMTQRAQGIPIGLATGFGFNILTAGILLVEILYLDWQDDSRQRLKSPK